MILGIIIAMTNEKFRTSQIEINIFTFNIDQQPQKLYFF